MSNERGEGRERVGRRFEDRAVTPCGQRGEEEQTECFDGRTDKIASATGPTDHRPFHCLNRRGSGRLLFCQRPPDRPTRRLPPSLSNHPPLPFPPLTHFYSSHAIPCHSLCTADWIIWSSCIAERAASDPFRPSKKGQAKPMDHEYLPT